MSIFPASYSLLSQKALLLHITDHYDIGKVTGFQYFLKGMNDTYIVTTAIEKYIFRVYRADRRSQAEIEFELDLLECLASADIRVSTPIKRKDDSFLNTFEVSEGTKYGVLFNFAEGVEKPIHRIEDSYSFGKEVARLHNAADHFTSEHERGILDLEHLIEKPLQTLQAYMQHRPEDYSALYHLAMKLKDIVETQLDQGLDWGICHGDLHGNTNVAFAEDGTMTHYDFDLCGYGWRAYDIAEFRLAREIHSGHDQEEVEQLWQSFLNGYKEIRSISDNDIRMVPVFVVIRQLWLFSLCFQESELIGIADFDDGFIDSKMEYFKRAGDALIPSM
ncbi:phosphotransferase [Paenibacillus sp. Marseille-Q4541]|uniref:phosphotransferase n=1 Tax=Paenibacillus sp. Marseille-Q4541 TaxID=2831522 RepID=UPI001BAD4B24|nr:phosphotransferase [Paenibacillus sp. Marseille-Q4541]